MWFALTFAFFGFVVGMLLMALINCWRDSHSVGGVSSDDDSSSEDIVQGASRSLFGEPPSHPDDPPMPMSEVDRIHKRLEKRRASPNGHIETTHLDPVERWAFLFWRIHRIRRLQRYWHNLGMHLQDNANKRVREHVKKTKFM